MKHTADIVCTTRLTPIRIRVMMLHLPLIRHAYASRRRWSLLHRCCHRSCIWRWCPNIAWSSHVIGRVAICHFVPCIHLSHPPYPPTSQPWVLVAVPPAIHGSLNKTPFPPKTRIQFCQSPADSVAFGFVLKPIPSVAILPSTCARVDAILVPEIL